MTNKVYIEPPGSEKKYRKLAALGSELGVPIPLVFLEMEVTMPDGKIFHHHKQRSHSWVRNAYNAMMSVMGFVNANDNTFGAGKLSIKTAAGAVSYGTYCALITAYQHSGYEDANHGAFGSAGDNAMGIQVGSGANAETFEDYALQTLIANGTSAGQLSYSAHNAPVKTYDAPSKTYSVQHVRYLNNNSPGDVAVNEVGLVVEADAYSSRKSLITRDKLGATVTIPASGQLKVTYTISLVYPA